MRRREFLIASSLGAVFSTAVARAGAPIVIPSGSSAVAQPGVSRADIHAVVYDARYAAARQLAGRVGRHPGQHTKQGVSPFRTEDCMVRLWRGPLGRAGQGGAMRIAGITLYSDFALARDCARDLGLRVLGEEWLKGAPVTLVSWLIGTA